MKSWNEIITLGEKWTLLKTRVFFFQFCTFFFNISGGCFCVDLKITLQIKSKERFRDFFTRFCESLHVESGYFYFYPKKWHFMGLGVVRNFRCFWVTTKKLLGFWKVKPAFVFTHLFYGLVTSFLDRLMQFKQMFLFSKRLKSAFKN